MNKLIIFLLFCASCTVAHVRTSIQPLDLPCVLEEDFSSRKDPGPAFFSTKDNCIHVDMNRLLMIYNHWGPEAVVGIMLHERHHQKQYEAGELDYLQSDVERKKVELAADYAAGCELAKMGLSDYKLRKYLSEYYVPNAQHGSLGQRVDAIQKGYDQCQ